MRHARGIATGFPVFVGNIKPEINNNERNIRAGFTSAVKPSYNGEGIPVQGGINIVIVGAVTAPAASAYFDEPLSKAAVLSIVDPFIV